MNEENKGSDYEKLIEKGYTEEELDSSFLDGLSRIEVDSSPLTPKRDDRGVVVTDSLGQTKGTSHIMMGYNKKGINLPNGVYISLEELTNALEEELSFDGEDIVLIGKKDGKKVEPSELIDEISEQVLATSHLIQKPTTKVTNQTAARMIISDRGKEYPKGVSMYGNTSLQLPNGEYVSKEELEKAFEEYLILRPKEVVPKEPEIDPVDPQITPKEPEIEPVEPSKTQTKVNETYEVIKRIYDKVRWAFLAAGAIAQFLTGFGKTAEYKEYQRIKDEQALSYGTAATEVVKEYETKEDIDKRIYSIKTGEEILMEKGTKFYSSSDFERVSTHRTGVVGQGLREQGDYTVDGFSILNNGIIQEVEWKEGKTLYEVLDATSKEIGVSIDDLKPMIHVSCDKGIAGWVEMPVTEEQRKAQVTGTKVLVDEKQTYEGSVEDFKGDTITINNGTEDVTLKVRKEDGSFVEPGERIVGSDGQEYEMTDIQVEDIEVIDTVQEQVGTKLNWSVKNMTPLETLAIAGTTATALLLFKKKEKEMIEMTVDQIDELIDDKRKDFIKAKGEYEGTSAFKRAAESLIEKKIEPYMTAPETLRHELIGQDITVENIENLENGGKKR